MMSQSFDDNWYLQNDVPVIWRITDIYRMMSQSFDRMMSQSFDDNWYLQNDVPVIWRIIDIYRMMSQSFDV